MGNDSLELGNRRLLATLPPLCGPSPSCKTARKIRTGQFGRHDHDFVGGKTQGSKKEPHDGGLKQPLQRDLGGAGDRSSLPMINWVETFRER